MYPRHSLQGEEMMPRVGGLHQLRCQLLYASKKQETQMVRPKTIAFKTLLDIHAHRIPADACRFPSLVSEGSRGDGVLQISIGQSTRPAIDDVAGDSGDLAGAYVAALDPEALKSVLPGNPFLLLGLARRLGTAVMP